MVHQITCRRRALYYLAEHAIVAPYFCQLRFRATEPNEIRIEMIYIFLHTLGSVALRVDGHEQYLNLIGVGADSLKCLLEFRHGCRADIRAGGIAKEKGDDFAAILA